jgi:hypothetical protein
MEAVPAIVHVFMPRPSFREWLDHRVEEFPDASQMALVIAGAAGGISLAPTEK